MTRQHFTAALLTLAFSAVPGAIGWRATEARPAGEPAKTGAAQVARGAYLVSIMGCNDCHTPWKMGPKGPEPDKSRALTGHPSDLVMPPPPKLPEGPWSWVAGITNTAFAGPWGVSFAANLTPDPETGLGRWTPEMFIATMKTGRHEGKGRPVLPPMPWFVVQNLTDDDIRALFAYLQSLPPVRNRVPDPVDPPEPGL
jgi:cytochrome c553